MDKILVKSSGKKISLRTAINQGILKDSSNFTVPVGKVIFRKGKSSKLIDIDDAKKLYNNQEIGLHQIIGDFNVNEKTENIIKSRLAEKTKKLVQDKYKSKISRMVLTEADKLNGYILYDFLKDNNISGSGKFLVLQNNQVILEEDLFIGDNLTNWWKDPSSFGQQPPLIGLIDSDHYIWNNVNLGKKDTRNYFKSKVEKGKRIFEFEKTKPELSKKGKITKKAIADAQKKDKKLLEAFAQTNVTFMFVPDIAVDAKKINQVFRENTTNTCFFDVIEKFLNTKIEEVKSNKNYITKLNKLNEFKKQYPNGMPENHIQKVCNKMGINIEIYDILGKVMKTFRSENKPLTTIKYFNTKINHLDDFLDYDNDVNMVDTYEDMLHIIKNEKNHFYYTGTIHKPNAIYTTHGTYKFDNKQNQAINDFNKEIKINNFAIDVIQEPEKYEYLRCGVNYNSHCSFKKLREMSKRERKELKHNKNFCEPDMKKAYSQFRKCSEYMGFCNYMTPCLKLKNWNVKKCQKYLGYYTCKVLSINDDNVKEIMSELGINEDEKYVFSSPMISFLSKNGFEFEITEGSYSFKKYQIPELPNNFYDKYTVDKQLLTPEMEKDGVKASATYCIWAGKLNACNLTTNYKFYGSLEQAEVLANDYDVYVNKYYNTDYDTNKIVDDELQEDGNIETRIKFDNKKVSWLGHIGGYITDYTRISVLEQMLKYNHSQIYGYKLDGFIIKGNFEDNELWRKKEVKASFDFSFSLFDAVYDEFKTKCNPLLFNHRVSMLSGAGGTGKSHTILDNMKDTLFTSLMWRLNVDKMNEYKIKGISWAQLVGKGCEPYLSKNPTPARIFIDEITMIDKFEIYELINKLPYTQFFLGGDVDKYGNYFQCSFKGVDVLNPNEITCGIIEFEKNYRCKDNVLLNRLNSLRSFMKECKFNKNDITEFVRKEFQDRHIDFKKEDYNYKTDWVLVSVIEGEKSQVKYYTDLLQGKKYRCTRHSSGELYKKLNGEIAYLNGEIMIDLQKESCKFERQDAFTIHSFQGITIKKGQKVFIDLDRLFCPRQLYTALSRVEYLDQIYIMN